MKHGWFFFLINKDLKTTNWNNYQKLPLLIIIKLRKLLILTKTFHIQRIHVIRLTVDDWNNMFNDTCSSRLKMEYLCIFLLKIIV